MGKKFRSKNLALNVQDLIKHGQMGGVDPYSASNGVARYATTVGGRHKRNRTKRRSSRRSRRSRR